jgi:hypothetical protein
LETHARRAYGSATATTATTAKAILARIKTGSLKGEFSSREVWRPQWTHLTDRDAVVAGLKMLVDYDWLNLTKKQSGGRPGFFRDLFPGEYSVTVRSYFEFSSLDFWSVMALAALTLVSLAALRRVNRT